VLTFSVGSQTCTGVTDASGHAQCVIPALSQLEGYVTLTIKVEQSGCYASNSINVSILVFSFPSNGAFVVGDLSSHGNVNFWAPNGKWARVNYLTSWSPDANSFSGFATGPFGPKSSKNPICGPWYPRYPDNNATPPLVYPEYMGVIVTDVVRRVDLGDGNSHNLRSNDYVINGNTVKIVVVKPHLIQDGMGQGVVVATYVTC